VNLPPGGLTKIDTPATEFYRLADSAWELSQAGRNEEAIAIWKKALELNPSSDKAHNNVGLLLAGSGKFEEAIPHFEKTLEINPEYPAAHSNLGVALAAIGKLEDAMAEFRQALAVDPNSGEAHNNLGRALVLKGNLDQAIVHFRQALKSVPGSASIRANLGQALESSARSLTLKGGFDEAIAQFQDALEATPESAEAHNGLAVVLVRKGRLDEAIAHFKKAADLKPDFAEPYFNLGDTLFYLQGKSAEALTAWRAVLRLDPDHVAVLNQTAWVLATSPDPSLRDGAQAVTLAQRAARLADGRQPAILDTLAAAYAETGRFDEAVQITSQRLEWARHQENRRLAEALEARLALYRAGVPFRNNRRAPSDGRRAP
jgi:tetratricopeptide (TPR) repeat protein